VHVARAYLNLQGLDPDEDFPTYTNTKGAEKRCSVASVDGSMNPFAFVYVTRRNATLLAKPDSYCTIGDGNLHCTYMDKTHDMGEPKSVTGDMEELTKLLED
jgi:hypothetical protein